MYRIASRSIHHTVVRRPCFCRSVLLLLQFRPLVCLLGDLLFFSVAAADEINYGRSVGQIKQDLSLSLPPFLSVAAIKWWLSYDVPFLLTWPPSLPLRPPKPPPRPCFVWVYYFKYIFFEAYFCSGFDLKCTSTYQSTRYRHRTLLRKWRETTLSRSRA